MNRRLQILPMADEVDRPASAPRRSRRRRSNRRVSDRFRRSGPPFPVVRSVRPARPNRIGWLPAPTPRRAQCPGGNGWPGATSCRVAVEGPQAPTTPGCRAAPPPRAACPTRSREPPPPVLAASVKPATVGETERKGNRQYPSSSHLERTDTLLGGPLAHPVEQGTFNPKVARSRLARPTSSEGVSGPATPSRLPVVTTP
jgi:hypothetical protein